MSRGHLMAHPLFDAFTIANGTQAEIDTGNFLQRFALARLSAGHEMAQEKIQGGIRFGSFKTLVKANSGMAESIGEDLAGGIRRGVHWEFEEKELSLIDVLFEKVMQAKHS